MISVFGNSFDDKDVAALKEVLDSHLVGMGAVTEKFEQEFAKKIGFAHGIATNSCTNSFWLIFKALGLGPKDQVIIPNIHFFGVKNVLDLFQVQTVIVDVDSQVPNLNLTTLKKHLHLETKAIIFLEYGGYPLDLKSIKNYLHKIGRTDIKLILDAANSPFTKFNGKYTALDYDIAAYSFDMNKILVVGDGGMILAHDPELAQKLKSLSYYGIKDLHASGFAKSKEKDVWWELEIGEPSLKLPMNNLNAALGLSQLAKIEEFLSKRLQVVKQYRKGLQCLNQYLDLPPENDEVENDVYLFWLRLRDSRKRNPLAKHLLTNGIYNTVKYQPLDPQAKTPHALDFYQRSLCLPLNQNLNSETVAYIIKQLKNFFKS